MLKAEEAQQEIEAASEEASGEGAARHQPQQQQQEGGLLVLSQPHACDYTGEDRSPGSTGLLGQARAQG